MRELSELGHNELMHLVKVLFTMVKGIQTMQQNDPEISRNYELHLPGILKEDNWLPEIEIFEPANVLIYRLKELKREKINK